MSSYAVKYTSIYSDGTSEQHTSQSFDTWQKAAAYAAEITNTHMVDGMFISDWLHNYQSTFIDDAPAQLRIFAHIVERQV